MRAAVTVVTWNVQGLAGIDPAGISHQLHALGADVVLLQEVQRAQLGAIAAAGGFRHRTWAFKHWPVQRPSEGHGILARHPIRARRVQTLTRGEWPWSWRRRIALHATVALPGGSLAVVDTHLGTGIAEPERVRQAGRLLRRAAPDAVIGGDLNTLSGSETLTAFAAAGWTDVWARWAPDRPEPMTNWHGPRTQPPNQRLDYLLVSSGTVVEQVAVPTEWEAVAALSDHLPVAARIGPPAPSA